MRLRSRTWLLISVLSLIGAGVFWRLGEQRLANRNSRPPAAVNPAPGSVPAPTNAAVTSTPTPSFEPVHAPAIPAALRPAETNAAQRVAAATEFSRLRLRNTTRPDEELVRDDRALLLRNALIDTGAGVDLPIPPHLRAEAEPGAFIVQLKGPVTPAFHRAVEQAGANSVSYLPNNAFLVRATAAQAARIAAADEVRTVLSWEPYFKLFEPSLLARAVDGEPLAENTRLNVTLLPGTRDQALTDLAKLGVEVMSESRTPFGESLVVLPATASLVALARLPSVQLIEMHRGRQLLNDLIRTRIGISSGTNAPGAYTNYLGLNGTNVWVNVNDSGVDASHPGLVQRVTGDAPSTLIDLDGHGTHVAGTIAGSGARSETITNAPGSIIPGADLRGMAPAAEMFALPIDLITGPLLSDAYLQQAAATNYYITRGRTNVPISNNSWGYIGATEYTVASASYDAAVRDALPDVSGAQPILYVFAAGNEGAGREDGQGGEPTSIRAPGTGKNVITVGAIEAPRQITNDVVFLDADGQPVTNQVFLLETDSDNQVTSFSSRGNVEPGIEGRFGRFKPDVVAPGAFIASARSKDWLDPRAFFAAQVARLENQRVTSGGIQYYSLFVPSSASEFRIRILPNLTSPDPFPGLPLYLRYGGFPNNGDLMGTNNFVRVPPDDTLRPGDWFYAVGNFTPITVGYDIQTVITLTNDFGNYFDVLKQLNDDLGEYYRYESGTSMAAPAVTGLLALFQDYFQRQNRAVTPALLKALLINGARSLGPEYNFNVADVINLQGWGLVSLTNTLPATPIGGNADVGTNAIYSIQYADQTGDRALVTGQSRQWRVSVAPEAAEQILKVTLVWTDPPGNPSAGVKLVNDLDLLVRNTDTDEIYAGNDIPYRSDFNTARPDLSTVTNDVVGNVENVVLRPPYGTNLLVTVNARRVNVNAVTDHPDGIAQDFALVVSLENPSLTNVLTIREETPDLSVNLPLVYAPTNGLAFLSQRAGANAPRLGLAPGSTNQWMFFVFTNLQIFTPSNIGLTNGSNVAFITFLPPNLASPRYRQADIDLYVSTNPGLTNLVPAVVNDAFKSRRSGGTEVVFFTNAPLGEVYYIGVKAEDQQAAEFGFVALSSNEPFDEEDENGNRILRGMPYNIAIPDGSPDQPQAAYVFAIATRSFEVQRVVVTNTMAFDSTGDVLANLSLGSSFVVLNNHALDPTGRGGVFTTVFDDSNSGRASYGNIIGQPSDGPGSLTGFIGEDSTGPWILGVSDNALTQTATNVSMRIFVQPKPEDEEVFNATVQPNSADYYFIDLPSNATNLTVTLSGINPDLPLQLALRRGDLPTPSVYDKSAFSQNSICILSLGRRDVPPLNPGRYYIMVYNPNPVPVNYGISVQVDLDLTVSAEQSYGITLPLPLTDDARHYSTILVPDDRQIVDVKVGVRANHPRVSDLVFHVISPQGTRLLLAENRGGPNGTAYGGQRGTQRIYTTFTDDTNLTVTPIKFGIAPFTNSAATSVASNRIVFANGFEEPVPRTYAVGESFAPGWRVTAGSVAVVQEPVGSDEAYEGIQYFTFRPGSLSSITTNILLQPGQLYRMRVATGKLLASQPQGVVILLNGAVLQELRHENLGVGWYLDSFLFAARARENVLEFRTPQNLAGGSGLALDAVVLEEANPTFNALYLPEEPLKPLIGQRAAGDWRLEITDTRVGPPGETEASVDWRLEFIYAIPAIDAIRLTNGIPYFGEVSGVDVKYFYVDVPRCATIAENVLAGDFATLLLFGDRDGLPLADLNLFQDDYGPYLNIEPGGIARFTLTTTFPGPAPLRPGQRYYLAVRNYQPDLTNNAFGIRVQFDCEDPPLPIVPELTNAIPVTATIEPGPTLHYYQFNVSSNAIRADFELVGTNGNVDMYVRYGRFDDYPLPSPNNYDYKSDNPDPAALDFISIDRTSPPVPLVPGFWYVAVRNGETFPVQYTIKVTETYTDIVNLTNGVPYVATIDPVDPAVGLTGDDLQYYAFLVSSNSVRANFETFGATGDVNLYVRRGLPIPTPADFHFAGQNPGALEEFIAVTNTTTPIWLSPGWWFLAVENADITNVTYSIQATEFPAFITPLTNNVAVTNLIAPGESLDYYSFLVGPEALSAKFEAFGMTDDVQLLLRRGLPVPTFNDFTYASTNAGLADEIIELTPFSFPVGLTPGDWYLSIANPGTNIATYAVRASEVTALVIPLTNGVPYNASLLPGEGMSYYSFLVSSNATAAEFKLTSAGTGDLDLFLRKGPPLPDPSNAHYSGINPGPADEVIRLETNSFPIPLSPGLWYLAVTNQEAFAVSYEITATEFGVEPPPISGEITDITITETNVCITWISVPGTNYFVVAKTNAFEAVWTPVSPTLTAVDTNTTWCLAPPGPWRFFDVLEGESPIVPIPAPVPVLSLEGTNICVSWNSVVGTNYYIEAKQSVSDPVWTVLTPSLTASGPVTKVCYPLEWGYRFFRVGVGEKMPPEPAPLPPELVTVDVTLDRICIGWPTQAGLDYLVEGKRLLADPNWTVISEPLRGDGAPLSLCLDGSTEFRYFRIIEGVSVPPSRPPSVPVPNVSLSVDPAFQLCFTWDTLRGAEYFVEAKERFADPAWTVISPILEATGLQLSFCIPLGSEWRYFQVRRVNTTPEPPLEIEQIEITEFGPRLRWTGLPTARYQVFYADGLPALWKPIGGVVTSTTPAFQFVDDGSETGGFTGFRFYRIERLP